MDISKAMKISNGVEKFVPELERVCDIEEFLLCASTATTIVSEDLIKMGAITREELTLHLVSYAKEIILMFLSAQKEFPKIEIEWFPVQVENE